MVYKPLIRFRYAIKKAAEGGIKSASSPAATPAVAAKAPAPAKHGSSSTSERRIPAPPGVTRQSIRIESAPPRRALDADEMLAIEVRLMDFFSSFEIFEDKVALHKLSQV